MSDYRVVKLKEFDTEGVRRLLLDAGWGNYADKIDKVAKGASKSLALYGAFYKEELVGYARVVGDGFTIIYIQDIVVLKTHKRNGIGKRLVDTILDEFKDVRQKVLITDNNPESVGFYKSCGFIESNSMNIVSFVRFD